MNSIDPISKILPDVIRQLRPEGEPMIDTWPEPTEAEIEQGYADHLARERGEDEPPPEMLEQLERRRAAVSALKERLAAVQDRAARIGSLSAGRKGRGKRAQLTAAPRTGMDRQPGTTKAQGGTEGGVA